MTTRDIPRSEAKASLLGGQSARNSSYQSSAGGYRAREGYPSQLPPRAQTRRKMYIPNSLWTWTFTVIVFMQLGIVLSLESYVFAVFDETLMPSAYSVAGNAAYTKALPTFLSLFMFGMFYQLILVWDALRLKNTIQIIGLCLYNLGLLIYAVVQIDQINKATDGLEGYLYNGEIWTLLKPSLIIIPLVLGLGTIAMSLVAWRLYGEFAWTIYKHISADVRMKRRYLTFQIYIALLKFDFFFFLGFTVQFLVNVVNPHDVEFGLTAAAIPITIVILYMAARFTRRENKGGMAVIIVLYFAALAYFVFKLVRMYTPPKNVDFKAVIKPLTSFAVITLILILLTIINAIACTLNFNKGLKPHITNRKVENDDEKGYVTEMPNLAHAPVPSRMTID